MIPIDQTDDILIVKSKSLSIILFTLLRFPLIMHGSKQIAGIIAMSIILEDTKSILALEVYQIKIFKRKYNVLR